MNQTFCLTKEYFHLNGKSESPPTNAENYRFTQLSLCVCVLGSNAATLKIRESIKMYVKHLGTPKNICAHSP